ncbi:hypothetical protein L6164_026481 [Bauhinia variegata]|uniref:Uncharacterized protein n=1 Tax=Bauhinia variegata TaxID=167791 RepID=A0ACB9LQK2_BAUVA|nr:hypothetical protein L6164_026481 [Bauhinia variegata]
MISHPYHSMLVVLLVLLMNLWCGYSDCQEYRCGDDGPPIRFPFYLIHGKTDQTSYPEGFGQTCTDKDQTILELSNITFLVDKIDYYRQYVSLRNPENCLAMQFLNINHSSIFPLQFDVENSNLTFFNCSSLGQQKLKSLYTRYSSYQDPFCPIYVAESFYDIVDMDVVSCIKMFDVTIDLSYWFFIYNHSTLLTWSTPNCSMCESQGMQCKLKNNWSDGEIECFTCHKNRTPTSRILIAAGVIGPVLLVLLVIALFHIYNCYKTKGEDQARVENFLEDYRSQKPTRFSFADIKRITNGFKEKLGEGAHGAVFKGKLSEEIIVAVKILNNTEGDGKEFINEVGTMGKIHHVNVVRLLGFCADGVHRAFIYDFFPNGSLQNFITPPDNKLVFLGWQKLEQIALGVAKGIEYLHQGCDQRILHFDINPHNVLLDENFIPKISDFGLAKLCSKNRSTVSMTAARGTLGYIAPEVFSRNFGNVSYKSDIYSYGMLLLEMVGGRKNTNTNQETFKVLYPKWIHSLLEGGEDVRIHIENEGDTEIAKKLAITGLWCIQWHPTNRPSMKTVLLMLEGKEDKLKVPPNNFGSSRRSAIIPATHVKMELEVIHELE